MLVDFIIEMSTSFNTKQKTSIAEHATLNDMLEMLTKLDNLNGSEMYRVYDSLDILKRFVNATTEDCTEILRKLLEKNPDKNSRIFSKNFKTVLCRKSKLLTTEDITKYFASGNCDKDFEQVLLTHQSCRKDDNLKLLKELKKETKVKDEDYIIHSNNLSKIEDFSNKDIINHLWNFNFERILAISKVDILETRLNKLKAIAQEAEQYTSINTRDVESRIAEALVTAHKSIWKIPKLNSLCLDITNIIDQDDGLVLSERGYYTCNWTIIRIFLLSVDPDWLRRFIEKYDGTIQTESRLITVVKTNAKSRINEDRYKEVHKIIRSNVLLDEFEGNFSVLINGVNTTTIRGLLDVLSDYVLGNCNKVVCIITSRKYNKEKESFSYENILGFHLG